MSKSEIFAFDNDNLIKAKEIIANYPTGRERSAILPLLDLAQRQNKGWLSVSAIEYVANMLSLPYMRAYEVASFYTMFNLKPVGKYHLQICGTTPCWLRGAAEVIEACAEAASTSSGQTSNDGMFTITEVECLGACVNAPVVQINDDYYENVTPDSIKQLINKLKK